MSAVWSDFAPQTNCDGCPAAQFVDQMCMTLHAANIRNRFGQVKRQYAEPSSDDIPEASGHSADMTRTKKTDAIEVGQRLKRTRVALGYDKRRRFAEITGVPEANLEKWENGGALTPTWFGLRLKDMFHVTLDWLYTGDMSNLQHQTVLKLVESGSPDGE